MYAAFYSRALRELGCDVWLAAPAKLIAAMPAVVVAGADGTFEAKPWEAPIRLSPASARPWAFAGLLWEGLSDFLDRASRSAGRYPDLILHLYLDDFLSETLPRRYVETRIACPFAGLWFKPPPGRPPTWREAAKRVMRAGRWFSLLRSPRCSGLLLLDASDSGKLSRSGGPKILEVPEVSDWCLPSTESGLIAEIRRWAAGRRVFTVVGSLEERKGLQAFLRAADAAPADEWCFVMAGRLVKSGFAAGTLALLETLTTSPRPRVLLHDTWLDDEVLNSIVTCSNLVHVYYPYWPYSTNMLCKAAAASVPVIGINNGYIGRMLREYDLGFAVPPGDDLAALFRPGFAAEVAAFGRSEVFLNGCSRYLAANNPTALRDVLARLLRLDHLCAPPTGTQRLNAGNAGP